MRSRIRGGPGLASLLGLIASRGDWSQCAGNSESNAGVTGAEPSPLVRVDVGAWLNDYQKADMSGREALLKCWYARERGYVGILRQCSPEDKARAKELLVDLWRRNRLTPADRAATVSTLVSVSLIEVGAADVAQGHRELVIQAERQFPFPKGTWLEWSYDIAICTRPLRLDPNSGNSRDWEGIGTLPLGSFGSSGHFGTPSARAIIEVREMADRKVVWQHTWEVGPTRLKPIPPPRPAR